MAEATKKKTVRKKKAVASGDLTVKGNLASTVADMLQGKGHYQDRWGNKIYATKGKANKERLAALK